MRRLILLATIVPAIAAAAPAERQKCGSGTETAKQDRLKTLKRGTLAQQPPASQVLAVYRKVDNCPQPIVLRDGIGMKGSEQPGVRGEPRLLPLR